MAATTPSTRTVAMSGRERFLRDEFHGLTLAATMQRGKVYPKGLGENLRTPVHESLRRALDDLSQQYASQVSDRRHLNNIQALAKRISTKHRDVLNSGRFRIGSAQKALNLFLKYLWCARIIREPPHCPFDARVIATLPPDQRCTWTTLDDLVRYQQLVAAARRVAGGKSLAMWELNLYNNVSVAAMRARRPLVPPSNGGMEPAALR